VSDTPLKALIEHVAAFSSRDNQRFAEILSLPFIHLWQDGEIWRYEDRSDVDLLKQYAKAEIDAENFGRTELDEARLILDWDGLKAFYVRFTRYSAGGDKAGRAEAIWVAIRDGECWKLKLRIGARRIQ
jgi:hypothetical protein